MSRFHKKENKRSKKSIYINQGRGNCLQEAKHWDCTVCVEQMKIEEAFFYLQLRFKNPAMKIDSLFNTAGLKHVNLGWLKMAKIKNTKKYIHRVLESIHVKFPLNCVL